MLKKQFKQKIILLFLFALVYGNFVSCRKGCITKSLGVLNCNPGYISVSDAKYNGAQNLYWKYGMDQLVVINDIDTYKEAFANPTDSMPLGYVDFSTSSLVGVEIYIDAGSSLSHQGCFCYNPTSEKWFFKIEYTLSHQCKGSGIYSSQMFCSIICPKLPANAVVIFESRNINPL